MSNIAHYSLKWSPAAQLKRPDNIISSQAREKNHSGFIPTYEKETRATMNFLLSNEYLRIWFQERALYEKDTYVKADTVKQESGIRRRFVQRMMTYKCPTKNCSIDDKTDARRAKLNAKYNIKQSNIGNVKDYSKFKFKPSCLSQKFDRDGVKSKEAKQGQAKDDGEGQPKEERVTDDVIFC